MHDPNFERTVQQKMEELQFHPADSVWINIEKAVAGQRHRRGMPLFWRFALPVFLAAAATGVYYFSAGPKKQVTKDQLSKDELLKDGLSGDRKMGVPTVPGASVGAAGTTATTPDAHQSTSAAATIPASGGTAAAGATASARTRFAASTTTVADKQRQYVANDNSRNNATKDFYRSKNSSASKAGDPGNGTEQQGSAKPETGETILTTIEPHGSRKAWFYQPELANQRQTQTIKAARLNNKATIAIARLQKKTRPWEAGFVAGGGLSRLNRLNASEAAAAVSSTASSFYRINGSSAGNAYISDVRSDAAFSGGVYLQKAIADRWTFNTGLTLHYYSSRITIGQQVNTYVQTSASFVNSAALATLPSAAVYSAGDHEVYTNRYYFLELPLNMQWQVNHSHLLPLFLEGGFSLARLMSANALLYDSETGLYSKQGNDINKTQVYASSALMAGLPFHGLHIQIGPQVQYGLTPIVDGHSLGDQHFFYAGVRLVVIPGKK